MAHQITVRARTPAELEAFLQGIEFVNDSAIELVERQGPHTALLIDLDGDEDEDGTVLWVNGDPAEDAPKTTEPPELAALSEPQREAIRAYARNRYGRYGTDGDIDFDDVPTLAVSNDGAYVQMWGWVRFDDVGINTDETGDTNPSE